MLWDVVWTELRKILSEYWDGVKLVLGFAAAGTVLLCVAGEIPSYESLGRTIVQIFFVVGLLALGFFIERVWKALRGPRDR